VGDKREFVARKDTAAAADPTGLDCNAGAVCQ
jgi:hypothetical protein